MSKIYDPESPNELGGVKMYGEPGSPNEGSCFTQMMNRNRHIKDDEPESRDDLACLRNMRNRNRPCKLFPNRVTQNRSLEIVIPNSLGQNRTLQVAMFQ